MKTRRFTARANGVYRMPLREIVAKAATSQQVVADLGSARCKKSALDLLASAFAMPDGFGGNWDSLNDALQDLSWLPAPGKGVVLLLSGTARFSGESPEDFALLLEILDAAAAYWRRKRRVFTVFCDAGGLPEFPGS